jgi:hypothetical protein
MLLRIMFLIGLTTVGVLSRVPPVVGADSTAERSSPAATAPAGPLSASSGWASEYVDRPAQGVSTPPQEV